MGNETKSTLTGELRSRLTRGDLTIYLLDRIRVSYLTPWTSLRLDFLIYDSPHKLVTFRESDDMYSSEDRPITTGVYKETWWRQDL